MSLIIHEIPTFENIATYMLTTHESMPQVLKILN